MCSPTKIKVYFKYWFCLHCTFVHISIRSHCLSNISRALKGGLISKCYERGVNLTWNLDFQWQSLNTTIHNKLRLYIKENQNMVYVVFGFFFYFSWLFLDASSVASLKMCGSSKCLSFSWITKERCLRSTPCGISVWHCSLE